MRRKKTKTKNKFCPCDLVSVPELQKAVLLESPEIRSPWRLQVDIFYDDIIDVSQSDCRLSLVQMPRLRHELVDRFLRAHVHLPLKHGDPEGSGLRLHLPLTVRLIGAVALFLALFHRGTLRSLILADRDINLEKPRKTRAHRNGIDKLYIATN